MEKPQEDPLSRTLNLGPALPTATSASNAPQNSNPPPPSLISDDPRGEREMRDQKNESNLKRSNATVATLEAALASGVAVDLEKKLRRAERFGVAIQLSEEEKRRTRAERFGTSTGSPLHSVKNGESEELKRKARAERFGLAVQSPADEEAKKKARLERFGHVSKPDSLEEEKRKARAARFSQSSTVLSKTNSKALSDMKTTEATIKEDPTG